MPVDLEHIFKEAHVPEATIVAWERELHMGRGRRERVSAMDVAFFLRQATSREELLVRIGGLTRPELEIDRWTVLSGIGLGLWAKSPVAGRSELSFGDVLGNIEEILDAIDARYRSRGAEVRSWREEVYLHEGIVTLVREGLTGDASVWDAYSESQVLWATRGEQIVRWIEEEEGFREFARRRACEVLERGGWGVRDMFSSSMRFGVDMFKELDDNREDLVDFYGWRKIFSLLSADKVRALFVRQPEQFSSWLIDWAWLPGLPEDLAVDLVLSCPEGRLRALEGEPGQFFGTLSNEARAKILAHGTPWLKQQVFGKLGRTNGVGRTV